MKTKLRLLLLSVILPALPMYYTQAQEVTIEISVAEDAYLNYVNWYANPNSRSLIASAWTHNFSPGIGRSFIRFMLPDLPPGATNLKAYLNLYHDPNSGHTGHAYLSPADENAAIIQRVTEPWNSHNMNWLNQPGVTSASSVKLPKTNSSNQNFLGIDVTSMVVDCYSLEMDSIGMRISLLTEVLYRSMVFASGNNPDPGRHPKLILTYDTNSELQIFPNPTLDVITIRDMGSLLTRVDVFNTLGVLVYRLYPIPETTAHRFNIQVLPAGVYYFKLRTKYGTKTERVVVVK